VTGDSPDASATPEASPPETDSSESGAGNTIQTPPHVLAAEKRNHLTSLLTTLAKVLGVVVTLVTLVGGTVTVLFQLNPSLEPCIGGSAATFTSVEVAPNYPLAQYLRDVNHGQTPPGLPPLIGAEIRYNYSTSNLSGNDIRLYTTLQEVLPNGDVRAPPGPPPSTTSSENLQQQHGVPGQPPPVVTPNKCSQDSSGFNWMELPQNQRGQHHRYRIVLEFYRGPANTFTDRVGVGETAIFDY
jgi:hypothetical protein